MNIAHSEKSVKTSLKYSSRGQSLKEKSDIVALMECSLTNSNLMQGGKVTN